MTISTSSLVGGGLPRKVVSTVSDSIVSGASGDVLTLTPPESNQFGFLRALSSTTSDTGMTLTLDGNDIQSGKTLLSSVSDSGSTTFIVSTGFGAAGTGGGATYLSGNCYNGLWFSESLVLTKDAGSTSNDILYTVDYMESM